MERTSRKAYKINQNENTDLHDLLGSEYGYYSIDLSPHIDEVSDHLRFSSAKRVVNEQKFKRPEQEILCCFRTNNDYILIQIFRKDGIYE